MSTDTQLPEHLAERGWVVAHVKAPDETTGDPGLWTLSRLVSSKSHDETGTSFEAAVAAAEAFDSRIEEHGSFVRSAFGNPTQAQPSSVVSEEPGPDQQDATAPEGVGVSDLSAGRADA